MSLKFGSTPSHPPNFVPAPSPRYPRNTIVLRSPSMLIRSNYLFPHLNAPAISLDQSHRYSSTSGVHSYSNVLVEFCDDRRDVGTVSPVAPGVNRNDMTSASSSSSTIPAPLSTSARTPAARFAPVPPSAYELLSWTGVMLPKEV